MSQIGTAARHGKRATPPVAAAVTPAETAAAHRLPAAMPPEADEARTSTVAAPTRRRMSWLLLMSDL